MRNSRTKNTVLILLSSSVRQVITLIVTFVVRTLFIKTLGSEYLGLNGLFSNILSLLALSELGIGTAITFYLYKPIEENNTERIKSLMDFYKICYRVVGLTIIALGVVITPFLPKVVNFNTEIDINLYAVYFLYIINTASSYLLFAYKQTFLLANQQQYKVEHVSTFFCVVQFGFDVVNIAILKNFYLYLIGDIVAVLIKNVLISYTVDKEFPFLKDKSDKKLSKKELKQFFNDIFSVSVFRVGSQLFNATDNIIISIVLGTIVVGYYSNYYLLISYATLFFGMVMKSFTAGIGNVIAKDNKDTWLEIYKKIDFIMFVVSTITSVIMCQCLNSFMTMWVGKVDSNYILPQIVVFILSFDFYINCSCQTINTFRETSGNFRKGQFLQLIGGILNIILSFALGYILGLTGIFLATVISKLCVTITPFIWIIAKDIFENKPVLLLLDYYKKMILRTVAVIIVWFICRSIHMAGAITMIGEAAISIIVSLGVIVLFYFNSEEFSFLIQKIKTIIIAKKI